MNNNIHISLVAIKLPAMSDYVSRKLAVITIKDILKVIVISNLLNRFQVELSKLITLSHVL